MVEGFPLAFPSCRLVLRVCHRFCGLGFGVGFFFGQQGFAVRNGNLVVIRVNLGKREESMPIAAIINEGGLQ